MYWLKIFGNDLFKLVNEYVSKRKMSISTLVRISVEEYIKGH